MKFSRQIRQYGLTGQRKFPTPNHHIHVDETDDHDVGAYDCRADTVHKLLRVRL